jgi:DNA polymerase-1
MGKTLNFAAIYGAQPKKIAATARISEVQAEAFLASYWKALPKVQNWINSTKYKAHAYGGITTLGGRFIPLPGLQSSNRYERRHWERASVNYTIQGSAADIIKKSMIKCSEEGYRPILSVHDELLFNFFMDDEKASKGMKRIQEIMETIMKLSVPLVVDTGTGENWREAKGD